MMKYLLGAIMTLSLALPAQASIEREMEFVDNLIKLVSLCRNEGEIAEAGAMAGRGLIDVNEVLELAGDEEGVKAIVMEAYRNKVDPKDASHKQYKKCTDRLRESIRKNLK